MGRLKKIFSYKTLMTVIVLIDSFVPLVIWPRGRDYFYYPKIMLIYGLLLFALVISLVSYRLKTMEFKFPREITPLAGFMFFIILSALFSRYRHQAFFGANLRWEGAAAYMAYFLIYYFSYTSAVHSKSLNKIMRFIFISSFFISTYGILQYFNIDMVPRDPIRSDWKYWSFSTLGNPDFLGSYLSMILPMAVCIYFECSKKMKTSMVFLLTIVLYSALLCTRARGTWIGAALSILIFSVYYIKKAAGNIKKILALLMVCATVTFILNGAHNNMISSKFKSFVSDYKQVAKGGSTSLHAGSQRMFIWNRTLGYIFDRPILGSGPDTFNTVFEMTPEEAMEYFHSYDIYVDKAHNEYLQIIVTMGFPALIFYLSFLCMIAFRSLVNLKKPDSTASSGSSKYLICFFAGVLGYASQAFFNISVVSVAPLYWSLLGLLSAANEIKKL